jgi:hypothetical protein
MLKFVCLSLLILLILNALPPLNRSSGGSITSTKSECCE